MMSTNIFKKGIPMFDEKALALYAQITSPGHQVIYNTCDLEENMSVAEGVICQYWKPRFLLDHQSKCAYEFMTSDEVLTTVTENDIDWNSLKGLSKECIGRARRLDAHFPTRICRFKNGIAEVCWQLNPDGRYYMDDDGYGMTDDEEVTVYGFINRQGQVLVKFKFIDGELDVLDDMRKEAETIENKCNTITMKKRIFNLLILDESGSMSSIEKQAVDSVNETLQSVRSAQQKYEDQEHYVSFVTFNSDGIKTVLERVEAQKVEDITPAQFNPACCTPLYDAIGKSVTELKKSVAENDKVLVTIITDGYENASREYNQASIKAMTEKLEKQGWTFAYIGANQDAMAVSHDLGIKNAMNFEATVCGTMAMSKKLTSSRARWFSRIADNDACANENFFEEELDWKQENLK